MKTAKRALRRAIETVGNSGVVARRLRPQLTRQAVDHWVKTGRIPKRWAPKLAKLSGIPEHVLCPEFFAEPVIAAAPPAIIAPPPRSPEQAETSIAA